jgi:delta 1-pyrroline-5-carboxylate dehydrogenase
MRHYHGKLWGFIIGGILGILVGVGSLSQIKMSQRGDMFLIYVSVWGIFFAIGGFKVGSDMDEEDAKNETLKKKQKENTIRQQEYAAEQSKLHAIKKSHLTITWNAAGIKNIKTHCEKVGRCWECNSYWKNPESQIISTIKTYKNTNGSLQTDLNGNQLYIHQKASAAEMIVKNTHENDMARLIKSVLLTKNSNDWRPVTVTFSIVAYHTKGCNIDFNFN